VVDLQRAGVRGPGSGVRDDVCFRQDPEIVPSAGQVAYPAPGPLPPSVLLVPVSRTDPGPRTPDPWLGGGMSFWDLLSFAGGALRGHRLRTALSVAGVAVGIAAVVVLTALGEGARGYVTLEFATLGSNLIIVLPGKVETTGAAPFGGVVHDLTLEDFVAISRQEGVRDAAPMVIASETVRFG
jgi:hypothetical protein